MFPYILPSVSFETMMFALFIRILLRYSMASNYNDAGYAKSSVGEVILQVRDLLEGIDRGFDIVEVRQVVGNCRNRMWL